MLRALHDRQCLVLAAASAKCCFVWEMRKFQCGWQDGIIVGGGGGRRSDRGGRGSKPLSLCQQYSLDADKQEWYMYG